MIVIADIMADVVSKVSNKIFNHADYNDVKEAIATQLSPNVESITFLHGHPVEIIQTLSERDQVNDNELLFKKYPLIAMFQDMDESPVNGMMEGNLQIIIATSTQQQLKASQRYETTFKPILYPLYELLLQEIQLHKSILAKYTFDHIKYDRVFWGTVANLAEGTQVRMFNDYLDAIELQNLKLTFLNNNC